MNKLTAKKYDSLERVMLQDDKAHDLKVTNMCGSWTLIRSAPPGGQSRVNFEMDCPRSGSPHYNQIWMPPLAQMVFPTYDDETVVYETAAALATAVSESYSTLSRRVFGQLDMFQQVWGATTAQERRELLISVWKDIPVHRRPDFAAAWSRTSSESKKEFLCPAINMEDLLKGSHLIDLLQSRAVHPPWIFSRQDYEAAKLGITNKTITQFGLMGAPDLVLCMNAEAYDLFETARRVAKEVIGGFEDRPFTYGQVQTRETLRMILCCVIHSEKERCRIENTFWTTQPGLITLRIQAEIYSFASRCVDLLQNRCCSMPSRTLLSQKRLKHGGAQESIWSALLSSAPYHAPQRPDFALLLDFVNSKRTHGEDHILELRRSPLYFTETIAEFNINDSRVTYKTPSPQKVVHHPRAKGQPRVKVKAHRHSTSTHRHIASHDWNQVIQDVQYDAYLEFATWRALEELLTKVRDHFDKIHLGIEKNKPVKGVESIVRDHYQLETVIKAAWKECVRKIKPARRAKFGDSRLFHYINSNNRTKVELTAKQKVDYLLYQLCPDEIDDEKGVVSEDWHEALDSSLGFHTVADFLDTEVRRLIETESPNRFGAYHARVLSDLVMIAEIDRQLRTYDGCFLDGMIRNYFVRIKDNAYDNEPLLQYKAGVRAELSENVPSISKLQNDILHARDQKLEHQPETVRYFGQFTRSKYPEVATPTYENVTLMVTGERHLDRVWQSWTEHVEEHFSERMRPHVSLHSRVGINIGDIVRTMPMAKPEAEIIPTLANVPKKGPQSEQLSPTWNFSTLRDTIPKKELASYHTLKEKNKTRGVACGPVQEQTHCQLAKTEQNYGPATITLKDPHFTTIRALWTNEQLKDVVWKDFLRAMAHIGFGLQKLGGSSWLFTPPPEFGFKHSVYMHEPHPKKSLFPAQAFWKGRALTRRYGWDKNTFVRAV